MTFGDVEGATGAPQRTALSFIKAMQEEKKAAEVRLVRLRDTERPEFELVCEVPTDMDVNFQLAENAGKAAKAKDAPNQLVILSCMTLARYTRQIRVNGLNVVDDDTGSAFADLDLQQTLQVPNAWRAVRQLFIGDGGQYDDAVVGRLADRLTDEAGFNRGNVQLDDGPDPTSGH